MNNEVPKGWENVRMLDFLDLIPTGVSEYTGKRKYYSTGSITGEKHIPEGEYSFSGRPSRANRMSQAGDIFQARMFGTDKALLTNLSLSGQLFSTGFLQFRIIKNTYVNKLLYYFLKSGYFLSQRDGYATGSTQIALTDDGVSNIRILVPPLNEQSRIVAKLEKLLAKVGGCQERLAKVPVLLKRFRQSVLAAACSGRLTADWRETYLHFERPEELIERIHRERLTYYEELCRTPKQTGQKCPRKPSNLKPQIR